MHNCIHTQRTGRQIDTALALAHNTPSAPPADDRVGALKPKKGSAMADSDLIVLRSKANPDLFIITERSRYRVAMDAFHASDPDDSLIHVPPDRAQALLRGMADLAYAVDVINTKGLYRYQTN